MGQAKLRKAEILKLKSQPKLIGFGAYYHDDQDDGVSIMFSGLQGRDVQDFIGIMEPAVNECVKAEKREFDTGNYAYFQSTDAESAVKHIWQQLHLAIQDYNLHCFGTKIRPLKIEHQVQIDSDMIKLSMAIMSNIWLLQELNQIGLDNFNGMLFQYQS